ncbi:MAG: histidine kinase, partial [Proteobacteria bacterium]|nr:histidine kinase [Pseudomonadota bacterium]
RVFQRFHRLASSDTPGSGLGLAIVHTVVRAHGGAVRLLDPLQGKGLLVEIQIPFDGDPVAGATVHDHGPFLRSE